MYYYCMIDRTAFRITDNNRIDRAPSFSAEYDCTKMNKNNEMMCNAFSEDRSGAAPASLWP